MSSGEPVAVPPPPLPLGTPSLAARSRNATAHEPLALAAMALLALGCWLVQNSFAGIAQDSVLYTLFALARLHPDTLTADVFLRFGSQAQFTLFTPLYTVAIEWFGMEHAAALLLFLSQVALFTFAWLLARRFMAPLDATLGIALLALLPSEYGAGTTFHYLEPYLTPRMPAEALVIGAILAATKERYWTAVGCVLAGMLLHPIMAACGAAYLVLTYVVPLRPRLTLSILAAGFAIALGIVTAIAPLGRLEDKTWLFVVHSTSNYLFVTSWSLSDWSRVSPQLALLAIGCWVGVTPLLRRVCAGVLATVVCGMMVTVVFCDLLHVSLFIDLQAWRWIWLVNVLALVLAPAILQNCWQRGNGGQVAVVLLATTWVFRDLPADLYIVALATAFAGTPTRWNQHKYWRALRLAACAMLGLAICLDLSSVLCDNRVADVAHSELLQQVRHICLDGVIPGALLIFAWMALHPRDSNAVHRPVALAVGLAGVVACAWLIPFGWKDFTRIRYTPDLARQFAPWRTAIPPHAEVLWPEDNPTGGWYLLDRPSYWSGYQVAGAIFSKEKALLVQRRTTLMTTAMKGSNASHMDLSGLITACGDPDLKYVASWRPLAPTPYPAIAVDASKPNGKLYLYRCAALRS